MRNSYINDYIVVGYFWRSKMTEKPKMAGYECPQCHKRYKIKKGLQLATMTLSCPFCCTPIVEYQQVDFDPDDYDWPVAAGG
jgi:hypothetical protein